MNSQAIVDQRINPVHAVLWSAYLAKQAFLWLAIPLSLYLLIVTSVPMIHDTVHAARHAAGWLKCH